MDNCLKQAISNSWSINALMLTRKGAQSLVLLPQHYNDRLPTLFYEMCSKLIIIHEGSPTGGVYAESAESAEVWRWCLECTDVTGMFAICANIVSTWEIVRKIVARIVSGGYICNRLADGQALRFTPGTLFCRLRDL